MNLNTNCLIQIKYTYLKLKTLNDYLLCSIPFIDVYRINVGPISKFK